MSENPSAYMETNGSTDRVANWFVTRVVPNGKVRMVECLLTADALRGVESEHLREQVDREWISVRVQR